jgi:hypothetical protein
VGKEMMLDWNSRLIHQIGHVALSKINVRYQGMKVLRQQRCSEKSDGSPAGHSIKLINIPNSGSIAGPSV